MKTYYSLVLAFAVAVTAMVPAMAQTDIVPQPVIVERALAAPRLGIAAKPKPHIPATDVLSAAETDAACRVIGASYNFARRDARMLLREGTGIRFTIPFAEGVVYDDACGWLALYVRLDVQQPDGRWRSLDTYFRHVRLCGPTVATARDIGVGNWQPEPGEYLVRAMIYSYAIPLRADLSYDRSLFSCADISSDMVFTKIRVVESPTPADIEWEAAEPVEVTDARMGDL